MRGSLALTLALLMAVRPAAAGVQQPSAGQAGQHQPPPNPQTSVDALGVSFDRIKRDLGIQRSSEKSGESPLKLDYYVEVLGIAPDIVLFAPEDLIALGPVPGAPPTHREMIRDLWTKPEFKGQSVPIGSLAIMGIMKLAHWEAEQLKQRKKEEARRKQAEALRKKYPDLVVR